MTISAWQYYNPVRIVSELGAIQRLDACVPYRRVALITTPGFSRRGTTRVVAQVLGDKLVDILDNVQPNPDVRDIDQQAAVLRPAKPDALVALGGGSSIDTAKALARLLTQRPECSLTEHFREGRDFELRHALPVVAIPTTAGTGAEVTPFGTVWDFELNKKYSVTGQDLYPAFAVLDPELTLDLPEEVTISSGLDAISHALESVWNKNANPITQAFATQALRHALPALKTVKESPKDLPARSSLMQASMIAGLAISQTRTALAHSISYPLTTHYNLPHGFACSFTLPALLAFNGEADDGRLKELSKALGFDGVPALANELIAVFQQVDLAQYMARYVKSASDLVYLMSEMQTKDRAGNNIRDASQSDIRKILMSSLEIIEACPHTRRTY